MFRTAIGIIFALFILCFVAIVIEELFLAGKKRRALEKKLKASSPNNSTGGPHP